MMQTLEKRYMFTIIGIVASIVVGFIFTIEFIHKIRFLISFGLMGLFYAILYIWLAKINNLLVIIKIILTFILFGVGLSSLLGIRFETSIELSRVFGYWVILSLASTVFVYMFWTSILSLKNWRLIWNIAIMLLFVFVFIFLLNEKKLEIKTFPIVLAMFYIGVVYIVTYLNLFNLQKTIILVVLVLLIVYLLKMPQFARYLETMKEILILVFAGYTFYYIRNMILNAKNLKVNISSDNIKNHSELLTILAISSNVTIFGSILSIIPYIGTAIFYRNNFKLNSIKKNGMLSKSNHEKSITLSFTTFIIYITSFIFYDLICIKFYEGHSFTTLGVTCNITFWIGLGAFVSYSFSKCLFED